MTTPPDPGRRRRQPRDVLIAAACTAVVAGAAGAVAVHSTARSHPSSRLVLAAPDVSASTTPPPPRASGRATQPSLCTASTLMASSSPVVTRGHVRFEVMTVRPVSGRTCFAYSEPTVRLNETRGPDQVAKIGLYLNAFHMHAGRTVNIGTKRSSDFRVAISGSRPSYAVFAVSTGRNLDMPQANEKPGCNTTSSVTIYSTAIALGRGVTVGLPLGLRVCGMAAIFPYLTTRPSAAAFTVTATYLDARDRGEGLP